MISDDERAKLRFELANANLQSVSRAQGRYLTTLLVYICLIWAMYLTDTLTLHLATLELKMDAVWKITPFVTMVLTLAVIGTVNATYSAYAEVKETGTLLFGADFGTLFSVDTHKNAIDYLELLQILPWGKTRKPTESHGGQPFLLRLHRLIFPTLFTISFFTSFWAARQASFSPKPFFFLALAWACLMIQALYSLRPMYRWINRFWGQRRLTMSITDLVLSLFPECQSSGPC
jgi:hypothetical protein